jgi:hypothetical protein
MKWTSSASLDEFGSFETADVKYDRIPLASLGEQIFGSIDSISSSRSLMQRIASSLSSSSDASVDDDDDEAEPKNQRKLLSWSNSQF